MGGSVGKEALQLVPMVVHALPPLIQAFQSTKSSEKNKEDDRIAEVLEVLQGNRRDIDQILQDQAQRDNSYQALVTLMNRVVEHETQLQQGGAIGQGPKIRIEMDLPENIEDHRRALQNFVATLGRLANAYNQEQGIQLADEPMDRDVVCCESRALMSAPPFPSDETMSEKGAAGISSLLCCEICTQPYNSQERRPTLLPDCGHTFCKECLIKSRRRNHSCPTCRKTCDIDIERLPTNFSILDIMNEELEKKKCKAKFENFDDDDCKRNRNGDSSDCSRRRNFGDSDCDMTYEEQVQIATQMSLEDYQQKQADDDFLLAQRLQEEEDRLMRFCQHEDFSQKSHVDEGGDLTSGQFRANSRQTSLHESSRRNSDRCSGGCYDEEEMTRGARKKSYHDYHSDEQMCDDDDASGPQLSSRAGIYNEARQRLQEAVNSGDYGSEKSFSNTSSRDRLDDGDFEDSLDRNSDREMSLQESPRRNLNRQSVTSHHDEEAPKGRINCLDDDGDSHCDEEAYKGRINDPDDDDDEEECCRLSSNQGIYASAQQKLEECLDDDDDDDDNNCKAKTRKEDTCKEDGYEREMNAMLIRAIATHEEDKEKRRKKRLLREQEELELALALSLSIKPQHERGQTGLA